MKHCDISNYFRDKGFLSEKQDLRVKDVNNYLVEKLSLPSDEKPAKSKVEVVNVLEKHLRVLRSLTVLCNQPFFLRYMSQEKSVFQHYLHFYVSYDHTFFTDVFV